jgi:3-phosphoshikimate 1-carboxyvinyltransferase
VLVDEPDETSFVVTTGVPEGPGRAVVPGQRRNGHALSHGGGGSLRRDGNRRRRRGDAQAPHRAASDGDAFPRHRRQCPHWLPAVDGRRAPAFRLGLRRDRRIAVEPVRLGAVDGIGVWGEGPIDVALTGKDLDARGYVDPTVAAMSAFGAKVRPVDRTTWRIEPPATLLPTSSSNAMPLHRPISGQRKR